MTAAFDARSTLSDTMLQADHPSAGSSRPRVLFVYYSYTHQTQHVVQEMANVLGERGCEVDQAAIGFTDRRWSKRFATFPFRHRYATCSG